MPGYEATIWIGLMAPAATPKPIIDQLNAETRQDHEPSRTSRRPGPSRAPCPMPMSPAEFDKYLRADIEKWAQVVKVSGAKAE